MNTAGTDSSAEAPEENSHRCGYVAIVGRPNVGKSTLMNRILGQKLSIVTAKPQTTRQRITGIKSTPGGQVVYVDTPGIHLAAKRALNRYMNRIAQAAFHDVDLVLFMVEADRWTREDEFVARALTSVGAPVWLVLNKIDLVADKSRLLRFVSEDVGAERFPETLMIAARTGDGVADLERRVFEVLPFSRPLYDEDQFTDRSERFLVAERIREKLFRKLGRELPYGITVEIERFRRERNIIHIHALIWVERQSQKAIVIGRQGRVLKEVGREARTEIESLLDSRVNLKLWVKVKEGWADDERALRSLGYLDED